MKLFWSVIVILIIAGGGFYLVSRDRTVSEGPYACTMDAKMCPDGSYVGRTGPKCEFEKCPSSPLNNHADLIKVFSPIPNEVIASPLTVRGEARGNWYFEASFPMRLYDANGTELAVIPVQATGEWMTTEFVPFQTTLTFSVPATTTGTLVLEKDNPSGLTEFDDSISIPVRFSP